MIRDSLVLVHWYLTLLSDHIISLFIFDKTQKSFEIHLSTYPRVRLDGVVTEESVLESAIDREARIYDAPISPILIIVLDTCTWFWVVYLY